MANVVANVLLGGCKEMADQQKERRLAKLISANKLSLLCRKTQGRHLFCYSTRHFNSLLVLAKENWPIVRKLK